MEPYKPNKPWISVNLPTREELIAMAMGLIPGSRALKYYHDNPEGSATEFADLLAEDIVPEYRNLIKPALTGEDIDWEDAAKEAAVLGIPMPYTKFPKGHPKAGETIPNNLKEALSYNSWSATKSKWKNNNPNARKLYADPSLMVKSHVGPRYTGPITEGSLSTRSRLNSSADARNAIEVPAGPYQATNTGSDFVNQGQQAVNTNRASYNKHDRGDMTGKHAWQGDMYPPGRSLARLDEYGPYEWDKATDQTKYIRKMNDIINENENKWEYLINKTRSKAPEGSYKVQRRSIVPKEDIVSIALAQGRPDIAARVMADNDIRVNYTQLSKPGYNPRFSSYKAQQSTYPVYKDNAVWKDYGNRQVEKELREQFAMLPEDDLMRYKFADYYGVPDLYNDWKTNPEYWKEFRDKTDAARRTREATNRWGDREYEREIER